MQTYGLLFLRSNNIGCSVMTRGRGGVTFPVFQARRKSLIHLKGPDGVPFPTNTHHSVTVKDKQAQTRKKLTGYVIVFCCKFFLSNLMPMYTVFLIIKMILDNNILHSTVKPLNRRCLFCIHYCFQKK